MASIRKPFPGWNDPRMLAHSGRNRSSVPVGASHPVKKAKLSNICCPASAVYAGLTS